MSTGYPELKLQQRLMPGRFPSLTSLTQDRGISRLFHKPPPDLIASLIAAGATASDAREAARNTKTAERAFDYAAALREQRELAESAKWVEKEAPCPDFDAQRAIARWGDRYLALWGVRHRKHLEVDGDCPFCAQNGPTKRPLTEEEKRRKEWADWQRQVDAMDPAVRQSYLAEVEAQRRQDQQMMMMALANDRRRGRRRAGGFGMGPGLGMGMGMGAGAGLGLGIGMGGGFSGGDCGGGGGGGGCGGGGGGGGGGC